MITPHPIFGGSRDKVFCADFQARSLEVNDDFITIGVTDIFDLPHQYEMTNSACSQKISSLVKVMNSRFVNKEYTNIVATLLPKRVRFVASKSVDGNTI